MQKIVFLSLFFLLLILQSCRISKGFEALEVYNYFEAKRQFEKGLKRNPAPAAYGLSVIYYRNDNPFHDLDSAYKYVLLSLERYDSLKPKNQLKLEEKEAFERVTILSHREHVSERFFELARDEHSIKSYVHFASTHPWSPLVDSARWYEQKLAFEQAVKSDNSEAYSYFLKHYPDNRFTNEVEERLDLAHYEETTYDGSLASYLKFIKQFPTSPYQHRAQDSVYALLVVENRLEEYEYFVLNHPTNRNASEAWMKLYRLSLSDYSRNQIEAFIEKYPDFPYQDLVRSDLGVVDRILLPYRNNGLFGFMDESGQPVIPANYAYAGLFKNGLAIVMKDDLFGYIDKNENLVIDYTFLDAQEFEQGRAIVETDEGMGVIDRTGNFIVPPVYDDIGVFSSGKFYAYSDEVYRYYDLDGNDIFGELFNEAYSFSNGLAKVVQGKKVGFIREDGTYFIQVDNGDLRFFADSIVVHTIRDSVNLLHLNGNYILPRFVDRIGNLYENRAIIEDDGAYGYLDEKGEVVIPIQLSPYPNYFQFAQFKNGHAQLLRRGSYALMDSLGKHILPAKYDRIGDYGPLIPILRRGRWGYIDNRGYAKIKYQFDFALGFEANDLAIVQLDGKMGVIDLNGDFVIPAHFDDVQLLSDSIYIVRKNNTLGFIHKDGELLTPIDYIRFHQLSEDLIQLEAHDRLDYYIPSQTSLITIRREDE